MKHTNLLTQVDKDMFDRIDRDCLAMHVCPPPKTFIELSVKGADGVEVERYTDRAHSWVRNAYNSLATMFLGMVTNALGATYGSGQLNVKTLEGTVRTGTDVQYPPFALGRSIEGAGSYTEAGIVVGTGISEESFENHNLITRILSGNTSGRLLYNSMSPGVLTWNSGTKKFSAVHSRVFNNNSGAEIIVSEVGLSRNVANPNQSGTPALFCRDLLATAVTVPNAGQLTVTYTIEMTFPA